MKLTRRSFLQTLSALLGGAAASPLLPASSAAAAPLAAPLAAAPVAAAPLAFEGLAVRSLLLAASSLGIKRAADVWSGSPPFEPPDEYTLKIEAYLDFESLEEMQRAYRAEEAVDLDLPVLRSVGVGRSSWHIRSYSLEARVDTLSVVSLELSPAGPANFIEPTHEADPPHLTRR